jgi:hypothetical protein
MLTIRIAIVVAHIGQAAHYRLWWLFPTIVTAGFTEIIGWSARVYSSLQPTYYGAYLLQSVHECSMIQPCRLTGLTYRMITTSLAPTFMVAANFIILGHIITRVGAHYSRIAPRLCGFVNMC